MYWIDHTEVEELAKELDTANYTAEAADVRAALAKHQAGQKGPFRGWHQPAVWAEDALDVGGIRWPREGDTPGSYIARCKAMGQLLDPWQLRNLEFEQRQQDANNSNNKDEE